MKGNGNKSEEKSLTAVRESKQIDIQNEEKISTIQGGVVISSPTLTAGEPATIVLNPNLGSMNLGAQNDLGKDSLVDLLPTMMKNARSLASMVQESIDKSDDDDEEMEDMKEAKELAKLLKKIARRIVPFWNIETLRGEHRGEGTKVFGVKITSKQFEGESRTYTLAYLEEKDTAVINGLRRIGSFRPSDYGILVEYVRLLIEEQKVTQVDSLSDHLNNCLPEGKARELFDFMVTRVIENLDFFPTPKEFLADKVLKDISVGHYGIRLEGKEHVDRFDLDLGTGDVVAFGVTPEFLTTIFELPSHKVAFYRELIRSWREYGFLSQPATYDNRYVERVHIGSGVAHDFYLFRVEDFNKRKEAVTASLRYTKHGE